MENSYHKLLGLPEGAHNPNYYELLGVREGLLSEDRLEKAYRERIQKLQRMGHNPKYRDTILYLRGELRSAHSILSNPLRRTEYDLILLTQRLEELEKEIRLLKIKGYLVEKEIAYLKQRAKELNIPEIRLQKLLDEIPYSSGKRILVKGDKESRPETRSFFYRPIFWCSVLLALAAIGLLCSPIVRSHIAAPETVQEGGNLVQPAGAAGGEVKITSPGPSSVASEPIQEIKKDVGEVVPVDHENSKVAYVRAGYFQMGNSDGNFDERPARKIYLDGYYIARHEVTNGEYREFVRAVGHYVPYSVLPDEQKFNWDPLHRTYPENMEDYPVVLVSWYDAVKYCQWLSDRLERDVSLPTEAQWEKAARGIEGSLYPWGDGIHQERWTEFGNFYGREDGFEYLAPVATFSPGISPAGCWDMAGNAAEWCLDTYDKFAYQKMAAQNPCNRNAGSWKVLRGGSWGEPIVLARSTYRNSADANDRSVRWGFRYVIGPER